jgi:TPR repeat protein
MACVSLRAIARHRGLVLLGRRNARAARWLAKAARAGDGEAAFRLGCSYLKGDAMSRAAGEAVRWLRHAAALGHVAAQQQLANLLLSGVPGSNRNGGPFQDGLAPDPREALEWARKAAEGGSAQGQALLGWMLLHGPADLRDQAASEEWYKRSAAQACPEGALGYGLALLRAARSPEEKTAGAAEIEKAASVGLPEALYFSALLTEAGVGHAKDAVAAMRQFRTAALAGSAAAEAHWGKALIEGSAGVRRDIRMGRRWLHRAARAGDAEAAASLGDFYYRGETQPVDVEAALTWYRRAATLGHIAAGKAVAELEQGRTGVGDQSGDVRAGSPDVGRYPGQKHQR